MVERRSEPTRKAEETRVGSMQKLTLVKSTGAAAADVGVGELIFNFFDEQVDGLSSWESSVEFDAGESGGNETVAEEEEEEENGSKVEAAKVFWDSQEELLLATLRRTTSLESRIRKATKEALTEMDSVAAVTCLCRRRVADAGRCRECTRKQVRDRLQKAGFSCSICKSKWRSSPEIPAGEHMYLEVVQNSTTSTNKDEQVKVIIELNFKSEFKIGKACEDYERLISKLPEVYVGKAERMKSLIKILCSASKRCMKDKKMHMAPWRKHKYMQAKWVGKPEQQQQQKQSSTTWVWTPLMVDLGRSSSTARPKASMLTFDLLDALPSLHQATMIRVV